MQSCGVQWECAIDHNCVMTNSIAVQCNTALTCIENMHQLPDFCWYYLPLPTVCPWLAFVITMWHVDSGEHHMLLPALRKGTIWTTPALPVTDEVSCALQHDSASSAPHASWYNLSHLDVCVSVFCMWWSALGSCTAEHPACSVAGWQCCTVTIMICVADMQVEKSA